MFRFRRKHSDEGDKDEAEKKSSSSKSGGGSGKAMLKNVQTGLNSQWFRSKYAILKEFEGTGQARGVIDDTSKQRAIASTLGSLDGAIEAFTADDDRDGLKETADLALTAYVKIGNPTILDTYTEVCTKVGMSEEEITEKILEAADASKQIDIAVNLYSRAGAKEKLIGVGNKALSLYLEASELDAKSRSRLFDYVVMAYGSADDKESLLQAGDKALKNQIENRRLPRDKESVLDAQLAYEKCGHKDKLTSLGNQYVNLYLKEGLEMWLDKAITVYEKAEIDVASKLGNLADKVEEKGRSGMADTMRRKAGL